MKLRVILPRELAAIAGAAISTVTSAQVPVEAAWTRDESWPSPAKRPQWTFIEAGALAVPVVKLGPIDSVAMQLEDSVAAAKGDRLLRYGVGRDCRVTADSGVWTRDPASDVWKWVVDISAEDARGLRVHLSEMNLPPGSRVAVSAIDQTRETAWGGSRSVYEGSGPFLTGEVWTPTISGDRVRVEYQGPTGNRSEIVPFRIARVQHIYRDPTRGPSDQPCYEDVSCSPEWLNVAKACVGLGFVGQNAMFCSGQLISTVAGDHTPYLLTAHQCISTVAAAQSTEVFFDVRSTQCNGSGPPLTQVPRATGCSLVWTSAWSDTSLLMIEGSLPPNRTWAGWSSLPVSPGQAVGSVHFPEGGAAKLSVGSTASGVVCGGSGHVSAVWNSGPTGPGSAGGGLFADDGSRSLLGVLSCGESSCATLGGNDFGRFSAAYPSIAAALVAGPDDGFEPNESCRNAVPIVPGSWSGLVVKDVSEDWYSCAVVPGATLAVSLSFVHQHGDVDVELYDDCESLPIAVSAGSTNAESLQWTNTSAGPVLVSWRVVLASDTRNTYSMSVSNGIAPGTGACCLASGACILSTPGACASFGGVFAGIGRSCDGVCITASYVGPVLAIPDGSVACGTAATANVSVPGDLVIAAIGVGLRIVHPYQGDVRVTLRNVASGISVPLIDRPGMPQTPFGFPNDNYGASVTAPFVSIDSAPGVYDLPAIGIDNVSGPWKPESPLATFVGSPGAGAWQLRVEDCAAGEVGNLVSFTLILAAAPSCYANCDQSTGTPALTANDFLCFINLYAIASTRANCDGSTQVPVLTANDFQCFLNKYAQGCS